jgi:ADP-heptose:LPS heptosyltransferase/GT2 family glycosyltransferase
LRDRAGKTADAEFLVTANESEDEALDVFRRKISQAEISLYDQMIAPAPVTFGFLMVLPDDGKAIDRARTTIASLREQPHGGWRLTIVVAGGGTKPVKDRLLDGFDDVASRIEVASKPRSRQLADLGVEANDKNCGFCSILGPGDELSVDALLELAVTANTYPDADFVYSDEICVSPTTKVRQAYFKPQWSPDLLLSSNYIGRLWCARADLLKRTNVGFDDFLRAGEYDLVLRLTERAKEIRHVPSVLCRRRSASIDAEPTEMRALDRALVRRGIRGDVVRGCAPGIYRARRTSTLSGLVSIIIPTRASGGLIETCITTLRKITTYPHIEIICIENIPKKERKWKRWVRANADKVIETTETFNWSRFNNIAVGHAKGDYLLFLNDDIEIIEPGWLEALLEHAARPEVGIVGALLLYPSRLVQHAGIVLGPLGHGRHAFRYAREDDPGYFGLALTQRNVIAVTGACLLTRREVFEALGRFDEAHRIVNNDVDFCLKAWRHQLRVIFTPYAKLIHHEKVSRNTLEDEFDSRRFAKEWSSTFARGDPYFSPNLSREHDLFIPEKERVKIAPSGGPLMARDRVKNILIVKLDHIGDCIAALPAVRFLKQEFPQARFCVLAGQSTQAIWSAASGVDEIIAFDFFHPQSKRGAKKVPTEQLDALRAKLEPHHFDIAIDLRKHPETRHFLRYTGARYVAGFDHLAEFSWLDVALEWPGDRPLARKRSHVSEDLMNLAASVANAFSANFPTIGMVANKNSLPLPVNDAAMLFNRPVVCVHPGAGMEIKEWPETYFAELIELLVEEEHVHIALIGGKDETNKAARILKRVRYPSIWNFAGKLGLAELPPLLAKCVLFVGNDSGPKHLAAGLGIPTIGIHSGVVDDREWGPVGPRAVAIRREMTCSPCYLTRVEACTRGVACLTGLTPGAVHRACKRLLLIGRARDHAPAHTSPTKSHRSASSRPGRNFKSRTAVLQAP